MPYIPKEHEKYNLLPLCRERGGEVLEYPSQLLFELEQYLEPEDQLDPYGYKSYEEYDAEIGRIAQKYMSQPQVVERLAKFKAQVHDMNCKEQWSVLRYIGPQDENVSGLTPGRAYYWPTRISQPVYCGVIDDEEFTAYLYPTEPNNWEVLEDPTGMAYSTLRGDGNNKVSRAEYSRIMEQLQNAVTEEVEPMTELDFAWKEKFTSLILMRGKKYFEEGNVQRIQRCGDTYFADVEGSEDYEVEISLAEGKINELTCTCPYAKRENCKHMAAVLFALESGDISVTELPAAKQPTIISRIPMELPWLEAIDNLPEDIVRKELLKLAARDGRLKERHAVLYLGHLPEGQLQNWKADLQETAARFADRRGRIHAADVWEFLNELGVFLDVKLPLLLEVNAVMEAFHLVWIVMETALEWPLNDDYDELGDFFQECTEALRSVFDVATDDQFEQMLQWYRDRRNGEWPGDVSHIDFAFRWVTEPPSSDSANREIKFVGYVPYYLHNGEWLPFPKQHHIYYDFVEKTAAYQEAEPVIEEIIKHNLGEMYGAFGSCHAIWYQRKKLLMERYGIEWFSPVELNPGVCFD